MGHAFSTRSGPEGVDFDVGPPGTGGAGSEARDLLCGAAGLAGRPIVELRQVHGKQLFRIPRDAVTEPVTADGSFALACDEPRAAAAVRCADCVPILLAALDGGAVAAIHAGWRGTAEGIAGEAVRALADEGIPPAGLVAAIGPAIGGCCYEVGRDVAVAVARASGVAVEAVAVPAEPSPPGGGAAATGGPRLDLRLANRLQLERAGLAPEAIHVAPWCTACDEELFFSYRRSGGLAGRQMALIGWEGLA